MLIFVAVGLAAVLVAAFLLLRDDPSEENTSLVRACDVLTEQTAGSLLGEVSRGTDAGDGSNTRCQYLSESTGGSIDLAAQLYRASADGSAVQQAQQDMLQLHEGRSTSYPGLGDEAYLLSVEGPKDPSGRPSAGATTLSARAKDLRVTVFLNGGTDPEQSRTAAEKLIRDYLARSGRG
ncbi:hypothetical protein [Actinocorallia populi]|uniref:hypothetical protein n=1 Tax=Actinocorallia populi TaxID=2079200 RepID=UPI000D08E805|nr:hypothetical protein [Actinocorallia populi]